MLTMLRKRREHAENIRNIRTRIVEAKITVTRSERHRMIAIAAYYLAEKRRFVPGHELDDWLEAERCVWTRLSSDRDFSDNHSVLLNFSRLTGCIRNRQF